MQYFCANCGKELEQKPKHFTRNKHYFCNSSCANQYKKNKTDRAYIGKTFGKLMVIERDVSKKNTSYLCRCDCGNVVSVRAGHLTSTGKDRTFSCGCHRQKVGEKMLVINTRNPEVKVSPGNVYGRLTVIREVEPSYYSKKLARRFLVRCECGTELNVLMKSLVSGGTKSCGCYHREVSAEHAKEAFTTHGNSKERWYLNYLQRRHRESLHRWTSEMDKRLRREQPTCVVCGSKKSLAVDHVQPVSRGGELYPGNAVRLCKSCNSAKRDRTLNELPTAMARKIRQAAHQFRELYKV